MQTPLFWGHPSNASDLLRRRCTTRGRRTNWLIVGIYLNPLLLEVKPEENDLLAVETFYLKEKKPFVKGGLCLWQGGGAFSTLQNCEESVGEEEDIGPRDFRRAIIYTK